MKEIEIDLFACPHEGCRHELEIKEIFSYFPSRNEEIKDGHLFCKNCQHFFPIFLGIPIIVTNVPEYLTNNFNIIEAVCKQHGGMDKRLFADCLLLIRKNQPDEKTITTKMNREQVEKMIEIGRHSHHLIHHYHDISEIIYSDHPLFVLIQNHKNQNPFLILEQFLQSHAKIKNESALEIGCSFGGFLKILANFSETVVGMDLGFLPLYYASCILKHLPVQIDDFKVQVERNSWQNVKIAQPPLHNLLLAVGNGECLPFKDNRFSVVSSLNVLDVTDHPGKLLSEKIRVLKRGGGFLASAPFDFPEKTLKTFGLESGDNIWEHIQDNLKNRISILTVQDNIPWLIYQYQRYISVYNNLCFYGKKIE